MGLFSFESGYSSSAEKLASVRVAEVKEAAFKKIDGEHEKTEKEKKFIEMCNTILFHEARRLGLDDEVLDKKYVLPKQVHFLPESKYEPRAPKGSGGFFQSAHEYSSASVDGSIVINKDAFTNTEFSNERLFAVLLHEMVHQYSYESFDVKEYSYKDLREDYEHVDVNLFRRRVGYEDTRSRKSEEYLHFRGFNEAITEETTIHLIRQNQRLLKRNFGFSGEWFNTFGKEGAGSSYDVVKGVYFYDRLILRKIIKKVAKDTGKKVGKVWEEMRKNLFDGNMMYLRAIERSFGSGSLRILASMGSTSDDPESSREELEKYCKIRDFFSTDDPIKHSEIARNILNEKEKEKYDRMAFGDKK